MISRFRIRRVGVTALLLAVAATGAVALAAPASADTVGVTLSVSPSTVTVGNSVIVTETVTNTNGFSILQPTVRLFSTPDTLASITTLTSCNPGPGGSCASVGNGYEAILGAAIGGNSSVTVTFTLKVNPSAASAVETLQGQLVATNFSTSLVNGPTLTVNALADLGVTLTGKPDPGLLSMNLDFTVKVTNSGPGSLVKATYTATATSGLDVQGSSTCTGHNNTAVCTIGAVPVSGSATATFTVPIGLLDIGIPFTFSVTRTTSTPTDPNPANDTSSTTCTVVSVLIASCG
ncbi:MAG TPA: hypothetical protein VGD84_05975 [Pseudonocardiaceae bacterium]